MIGDSVTDSLTSFLRSSLPIRWKIIGKSLDLVWSENAPLTELSIWILLPGRWGGVLPYMGHIVMCRCEGYGFQAVYSSIGYINQTVWV